MSEKECFERLEELISDEDRTVTYKLLSRECKIHVNLAKQYLCKFAEEKKSEIKNLHSTYFVAGYVHREKNNLFKLFVVTENNLKDAKKSLSEVTSCHIFSVGKGKRDEWGLFRDDSHYNVILENNHSYSAIKNSNVEIKPTVLSKATNEQNNGLQKETKVVPKASVSFFKCVANNSNVQKNEQDQQSESNNVANNADTSEVETPQTSSSTIKQKSEKPQKSNTLASLWQKNEDKMKNVKDGNSKPDAKAKPHQETKLVPKNSIMNMFSKQAEKKTENNSKKSSTLQSTNTSDETDCSKEKLFSDCKSVELPKPKEEIQSSKPISQKRKSSQKQSKTSSKQKKGNQSDDEFEQKKKRKRICTFDDSDSESESEEAKDKAQRSLWEPEEPLETVSSVQPATPASDDSEELIPPTPPVVSKGKKKVWKTVQKTFEEDGFLVTKQDKELVSEDDEDPIPQNVKNKEASKPNQFTYRKQASLTSFFKQK